VKIKPIFKWYDFWVGFFWDREKRRLYFVPIPMFGVMIQFHVEYIHYSGYHCGLCGAWINHPVSVPKHLSDSRSDTIGMCGTCAVGKTVYNKNTGPIYT